MPSLSDSPGTLVDALGFLCMRKKLTQLLPILEAAHPSVEAVDRFRGLTTYQVDLVIPFELFIDLGERKEALQNELTRHAQEIVDGARGESISQVKLVADLDNIGDWRSGENPLHASTSDVARIWKEGYFRLFVSHCSADKQFCAMVSEKLDRVRVDAFIAHEAIEPDLPWQHEIKLGLASCHALMFVASEASNQSFWCQQEVGWALGRGVLVTSYMLGQEPVGFANSLQGWKVRGHDPVVIRDRLLSKFTKDARTESAMREPLVQLIQSSRTASQIDFTLDYVEQLSSLTQEHLERIANVISQPFVSSSRAVTERIKATLSSFGFTPPAHSDASADEDDYDPFAEE